MKRRILPVAAVLLVAAAGLAGCAGSSADRDPNVGSDGVPAADTVRVADARLAEVHRSPGCSCCHEWEAYLQVNGFEVQAADDPDIAVFKASHGVPADAQSCHTAVIGGYVVEGHVPVEAIEDLLAGDYPIDGIALPGMPPGSPGMPGEKDGPLRVLALSDGQVTPFGSY